MGKRSIALKNYFLKDINPVVRWFIISDVFVVGAAGMLGPVFALFIENFIEGANAATVGTAAGIYLITKSLFQIPIATIIDRIRGEKDDFFFLVTFSVLMTATPLLYLAIDQTWQLYLVQFVLGFFAAMTFPSFMAILTRHIDHKREGTEWGVYYTLVDLSGAALAAIGGYIAYTIGFPALIIAVSGVGMLGSLMLYAIKPYIKGPRHT